MRLPILTIIFLLTWGFKCFGQNYAIKLGAPNSNEFITSYVFDGDDCIVYCGGINGRYLYGKFNMITKTHLWAYSIDWIGSESVQWNSTPFYRKIVKLSSGEFMISASSDGNYKSLFTKIDNNGAVVYHRELIHYAGTQIADFDEGNNNQILAIEARALNNPSIIKFNHLSPSSTIIRQRYFNSIPEGYVLFNKIICEKGINKNEFYVAANIYNPTSFTNVNSIAFLKFSNQNLLTSFSFLSKLNVPSEISKYYFLTSFTLENNFAKLSYLHQTGSQNSGNNIGLATFDIWTGALISNALTNQIISTSSFLFIPAPGSSGNRIGHLGNHLVKTRFNGESESKFNILESSNFNLQTDYGVNNFKEIKMSTNDCKVWSNQNSINTLGVGSMNFNSDMFIYRKSIANPLGCLINTDISQVISEFFYNYRSIYPNGPSSYELTEVSLPIISHDFTVTDLDCPCLPLKNIQSQDITYPNPE